MTVRSAPPPRRASTNHASTASCARVFRDSRARRDSRRSPAASRIRRTSSTTTIARWCCASSLRGELLPSAHAVDREYRVMAALAATGVPVPRMVLFHAERDVVGTPFFVMERVQGRVFGQYALPGCDPVERRAMYESMADAMARLHRVDPDGGRARGLRQAGQLLRPPGRAVDATVGDEPHPPQPLARAADRVAAGPSSRRRRGGDLPRRLPHGQPHVPSDRAAGGRGAGLGTVDARAPARRRGLQRDGVADPAVRVRGPARTRPRVPGNTGRGRLSRALLRRGRDGSTVRSPSTSPSRCSGSR